MAQVLHRPATFSGAPTVHPVADSARETVKAQARHTPATNSDVSMVHPVSHSAWKTKKAKSEPARDTSAKATIQDGWSVPFVHSFEEFRLADTRICLATRSEAEEAMLEMSLGRGLAILTVNISQVFARKEVQFSEKCWLFFVVSEGFGAAFTGKSLLAQYRPVWFHVTDFKELGPVDFASGSFGAVFVNLLLAQYRPGWMHLPATVKSPRVMCLMNFLCLLPTGCCKGTIRSLHSRSF